MIHELDLFGNMLVCIDMVCKQLYCMQNFEWCIIWKTSEIRCYSKYLRIFLYM